MSRTCPRATIDAQPWVFDLIAMWGDWEARLMPFGGGKMEQPATIHEAMRIIRNQLSSKAK